MSAWQEARGDMLDELRAELNSDLCECGCEDAEDGRTPSKYQSAILHVFKTSRENVLIQAVAGSGKTSTLVMLARMMFDGDAVFLAFNRSIADELKRKLPESVSVSTFHALGWNALRPVLQSKLGGRLPGKPNEWVQARKCDDIFRRLYGETELREASSAVCKLVSLMKAHLLREDVAEEEIEYLISHFDVTCDDDKVTDKDIVDCAREVLRVSNETYFPIDFDDQLYMPWLMNVRMRSARYVMVDEAQDTNAARRWLLEKLVGKSGRLVAVGDEYQAIYGFTGADADSMRRIRDGFNCVEMPLSISYRCSASVVSAAQEYVPGILARDDAPLGSVRSVGKWNVADFRVDDMIVCRNTAPLVNAAYKMIARRLPCKIMGRDIGRGLIVMIERVAGRRCRGWDELTDKLSEYRVREMQKATMKGQEQRAQSVSDKVDTVLMLVDSLTAEDRRKDVNWLTAKGGLIDSMFSDNGGQMTTFATVHKSKGLEAPRVFILDAVLMPSRYARQPWQQVQERNLQYVAVTRAMTDLVYVDSDGME